MKMYSSGNFKSHNRPHVSLVVPKQKAVNTSPMLPYNILGVLDRGIQKYMLMF